MFVWIESAAFCGEYPQNKEGTLEAADLVGCLLAGLHYSCKHLLFWKRTLHLLCQRGQGEDVTIHIRRYAVWRTQGLNSREGCSHGASFIMLLAGQREILG